MKVPGGANVNKSLMGLKKSLKESLARVNQEAGMLLSKGNYERAESLVNVAKSIDTFRVEVESLHTRWKEIKGVPEGTTKAPQTPLWKYYQPILQALLDLDGAARPVPKLGPFEMTTNQQFSVCVCDRAKAAQESQVRLCFWTRRHNGLDEGAPRHVLAPLRSGAVSWSARLLLMVLRPSSCPGVLGASAGAVRLGAGARPSEPSCRVTRRRLWLVKELTSKQ